MLKILESYLTNKLHPKKENTIVISYSALALIILGSISIFASQSLFLVYVLKYLNFTYSLELSKSSQIIISGVFYLIEALIIFIIFQMFYKKQEDKPSDVISRSISAFLEGYKTEEK